MSLNCIADFLIQMHAAAHVIGLRQGRRLFRQHKPMQRPA